MNTKRENSGVRCTFWDEVEFQAADREFDAGEWSGPLQEERGFENEPCRECAECIAQDVASDYEPGSCVLCDDDGRDEHGEPCAVCGGPVGLGAEQEVRS